MIAPATLLGLAAPLTALLVHALLYRLIPPLQHFPRQKLALMVILITSLITALEAVFLDLAFLEILHAVILSLMLGYSYFHFFNMSETARRIRILVEYVARLPSTGTGYDAAKIYGNRIQRLREHGMIMEKNGKLLVKHGPMLWASYFILGWRKLFF